MQRIATSANAVPWTTGFLIAYLGSAGAVPAQQAARPALTLRQVLTAPASLLEFLPQDQWIPGSHEVSRVRMTQPDRVSLLRVGKAVEETLFTAAQITAAFAAIEVRLEPKGRVPAGFTWCDGKTIRVQRPDGVYHWRVGAEKAERALPLPKDASRMAVAEDDSRVAFVRDNQLFVQIGSGEARRLTTDGSEDIVYGDAAHRSEFGIHDGLWWSPDARFLAFFREDMSPITPYPYVDHTTMPPKAIHGRYPMAGAANSYVQVGIYDTKSAKLVYARREGERDVYWTNTTFGPDDKLYIAIVNRAQDRMELDRFDATTGAFEKTLFVESDEQWVEPEHGPIFLPDRSGRFLWFSPRDGYRHLYLYDGSGAVTAQITKGGFDVKEFVSFDPDGKSVFVMASGENPLEMHLWQADLAGTSLRRVTTDRGCHTCKPSTDGTLALDSFSNIRLPGQSQVLDIASSTASHVTKIGHRFPVMGRQELFEVKAEDGTPLHGTIILPPDLDTEGAKKYPALLYVYGGPHSQLVTDRWLGGANLWLHFMATQGFVVCTIDNRGTDNRGIEFSQAVFRHLGELEVKDQLRAVEYLRNQKYVDRARIGVHGWSFGGYMTLNLMLRSPAGTFACGASGAPVTDWRQYETGYTERYMDTPQQNPDGYRAASVLPLVKQLHGRLLLIQGTDDKTVMWSQSLAFVNQCVEHGVLLDYMPYPMQQHGLRGGSRAHLYQLLTRFFEERLLPGR